MASTELVSNPMFELPNSTPYVLAIVGQKGGMGRTTLAAALAWLWGRQGLRVTLVDADPVKAAAVIANNPTGGCTWPNVTLMVAQDGEVLLPLGQDVIIYDTPALTETLAQQVLTQANGVIISCTADSLALATLPAATAAIHKARLLRPDIELLGIVVNLFDGTDAAQARCLTMMRSARGGLLVEPPIPMCANIANWPSSPGHDLPGGLAMGPLEIVADTFREMISEAGWQHFADRKGDQSAYATHR